MNTRFIYSALIALSLAGYPLVAAFTTVFNVENAVFSLSLRVVIFFLALMALFLFWRRVFNLWVIFWFFFVFWLFYIARIFVDVSAAPYFLSKDPLEYWVWAIGCSFFPAISLFTLRSDASIEMARKWSLILLVAAGVIVAFFGGTVSVSSSGDEFETGRLGLKSLNAILVGYLGGSIGIISGWQLVNSSRISIRVLIFYVICLSLGIYLLLASSSRGPLVSFVFVLFFYYFSLDFRKILRYTPVLIGFSVFFYFAALYLGENAGFSIISRVVQGASGDDVNVSSRATAFYSGLNQFIDNPFFGSSLEDKDLRTYPHNVIVEAFMSTGLIGGLAFIFVIIYSVIASWLVISKKLYSGWVVLIYLQYLVGAQFSGAIYGVTVFWAFLAIVMAVFNEHFNCGKKNVQ
ncbi:MAG: O-antigen ligase family protein [Dechloromonas sp.]|nr:O-antigen ligase family protein [Dechloromonas sp.]